MKITLGQIADFLNGEIIGDDSATVTTIAKIEEAQNGELSFLSNKKYINHIYSTKATAVLVGRDMVLDKEVSSNLILVDDAYQGLTKLLKFYEESLPTKTGIEPPHFIGEGVDLPQDIYLGAFTHIGNGVKLGNGVKIYPQVSIGDNVEIGDDTILYSGVRVYKDCKIGSNCIIHSNAVLGSDGFGFAPNENGAFDKVPQLGNVVVEDDVEIGAGSTIDRATLGSTIIRKGAKLDNQLQIAHNVEIGENSVIAAQAGIAGSSKIGRNAMIGGQVGIVGHLNIGDFVKIQAQSGITKSLKDKDVVQGTPSLNYGNFNKSYVHFKNLDGIVKRINKLEKDINKDSKDNE